MRIHQLLHQHQQHHPIHHHFCRRHHHHHLSIAPSAPTSHLHVLPLVVLVLVTNLILLVLYPFYHSFRPFLPPYILLVNPILTKRWFNTPSGERPWQRNFGHFSRLVLEILFLVRRVLYLWVANGSSRSNIDLMVPLSGTRLAWLPEDLLRSMGLTIMRLLHLLLI